MKKLFSSIILIILISPLSYAQLGGLGNSILKKAGKVAEKKAANTAKNEMDKKDEKTDSVKFNYAIMLSDNSSLFETRDFFQRNNRILTNVLVGDQNAKRTPAEEGEEWLNIGENFYTGNKYKSAEYSLLTAKTIFEDGKATTDLDYFRTLEDLGLLYQVTGRFNLSENFTRDAMDLREQNLGKISGSYAASLNNLACLYTDEGKYNEAEMMLNEADSINEITLGHESLGQAIIMNNKAMLYMTIGRYKEAEAVLDTALAIAGKSIGENSNRYQKLMINKALLLTDQGRYTDAEAIYKEAIKLKERRLGKRHPDYAQMLMSLASLYVQMDRPDDVKSLLEEATGIYKDKFGDESLPVAAANSNLGKFYQYEKKYDEAGPLLESALKIRMDKLGDNNPLYVTSMEDMAINYWKTGNLEKAKDEYNNVLEKTIGFINTYFPPMSEAEKTKYWDLLQPRFQRYYSFVGDNFQKDPALLEQAFKVRLSTKALLLNVTSKVKSLILGSNNQALINDYLKWLDSKEMLARYYSLSKEELTDEKINLDSAERATNNLERSLSERSGEFSAGYSKDQVTINDISTNLADGESLVEIVQYRYFDNKFTGDSKYLALILDGNGSGKPKGILIDNGTELESKYYNFYKNAIRLKTADQFSYDEFWKKIDDAIGSAKVLYVSPDGIYNEININTLKKPDGTYVIDSRNLIFLGSSRDLPDVKKTMAKSTVAKTGSSAFLLGFPAYGDNTKLAPLPGTKVEIDDINKVLAANKVKTSVYLQDQALEQNIKKAPSPTLMHIATHGYFLKDVDKLGSEKVFGIESDKAKDNPLLRSGLFLTGSAKAMDGQNTSELSNEDNGILTAYEAMNLNLDNTDVVVLSACETGLGDIKSGEGVYGLQRAFFIAGSDAIVMSLWKVNDEATQQLMTTFYSEWVKTGNKLKAFRNAQLALKQKMKDPYFWGAFVMIGA